MQVKWNDASARHIMSRVMFGFTNEDLKYALSMPLDDFVDNHLLSGQPKPAVPDEWVNELPSINGRDNKIRTQRMEALREWWLSLMVNQKYSFREKMVLFLHNHFTSEINKVRFPQLMYLQNKLFRQYAYGNFKELTLQVTTDPAMLYYLDGVRNNKKRANENYARELMELFTLGIGNYTETDVKEAARALTGWEVNEFNAVFNPKKFDSRSKTFLGKTGNFNHKDILDIIFAQKAAAEFICRKLCREFICTELDDKFVTSLAGIFRKNNYDIKPVLSYMLKSDYFFSDEVRGVKIKPPIDFLLSSVRQLLIEAPDYSYLNKQAASLQQPLFSPPNVKGWEGQRKWISTVTLPQRNVFIDSLVKRKRNKNNMPVADIIKLAKSFASSEDAPKLVEDMTLYFLQVPLSKERESNLLELLLDGAIPEEWSTNDPLADSRLRSFLETLLGSAEYQLI